MYRNLLNVARASLAGVVALVVCQAVVFVAPVLMTPMQLVFVVALLVIYGNHLNG